MGLAALGQRPSSQIGAIIEVETGWTGVRVWLCHAQCGDEVKLSRNEGMPAAKIMRNPLHASTSPGFLFAPSQGRTVGPTLLPRGRPHAANLRWRHHGPTSRAWILAGSLCSGASGKETVNRPWPSSHHGGRIVTCTVATQAKTPSSLPLQYMMPGQPPLRSRV